MPSDREEALQLARSYEGCVEAEPGVVDHGPVCQDHMIDDRLCERLADLVLPLLSRVREEEREAVCDAMLRARGAILRLEKNEGHAHAAYHWMKTMADALRTVDAVAKREIEKYVRAREED